MIGEMRERILLQKSTAELDEDGNQVLSWQDFYSCAAYANNMSGSEYWAAAQVNAQTDMFFMIRYSSEVAGVDSENYRIIFRDQVYDITFVDNVKYENKVLKLRVTLQKEEQDAYSDN